LEKRELALFICDVPRYSSQTFFRGIKRVEPGRAVTINRSGAVTRACWEFPEKELYFPRQGDYVEAFREQLDRATRSRMRGPGGTVAAHLSAGLDSSAVAATAAKLDPASKVLAITSAPRVGFEGPAPSGRLSDESGLASETAALYPNMEHLVLRSEGSSPLSSLGSDAYLYQEPTGYPCNHSWWSAANQAASARGIQIMLTGEMGNLTISAGNLSALADYLRAGQWARWWKEAKASAAVDGWRWRGVLASSFGPWIPRSTWVGLNSISSGDQAAIPGLSLLLGRWQAELASVAKTNARSRQFEGDQRRLRWKLMQWGDPGNFRKGMLARWGIDERDPTADRRLAEFCLSLPPEQLLSGGIGRRLGRLALADRLPAAVLAAPRGYQYADWYEAVDPAGLMREIDHLEAQLGDASVLDLRQLKVLAGSWPNSGWDSLGVIGTYRILLLRAIAAGTFESAHCK
jgi:asparagine synthase (glutamine-hydrolysing)